MKSSLRYPNTQTIQKNYFDIKPYYTEPDHENVQPFIAGLIYNGSFQDRYKFHPISSITNISRSGISREHKIINNDKNIMRKPLNDEVMRQVKYINEIEAKRVYPLGTKQKANKLFNEMDVNADIKRYEKEREADEISHQQQVSTTVQPEISFITEDDDQRVHDENVFENAKPAQIITGKKNAIDASRDDLSEDLDEYEKYH